MTAEPRLGIDIGGTKTAVVLVADGSVQAMRSAPSGRGASGVVDVAVRLARQVLDAHAPHARGRGADVSVGACMPGLVDPVSGLARHAVNLDVESLDLAGGLSARLGVPVAVENDVKAAALGAWRLRGSWSAGSASPGVSAAGVGPVSGSTHPGDDAALAYLNLGTGLASAVVRDGVVVRGIDGAAGEIGHLPVGGDAPCTCGQIGCLETVASGSALARLWPVAGRRARDPFAAAAAGDALAAAAVDVVCTGVGLAVQLLALASGAERVVVGGGLAGLGAPLIDGIRADLERRARSSRMIDALGLSDRVELLPADVPVAALGAAWLPAPELPGAPRLASVGSPGGLADVTVPGERVG
ncbi:ROK family protein [Terracoccus sp. 273MFTsu3.1]|uniref:ROK family protein n=1 Tax=Terracoccus sp. 273MFTsu3.1 TaxID=1172188 RepID=UPI00036907EA|nr:ROK family protein [Terracoccus sp. 273MFTsu3.1]